MQSKFFAFTMDSIMRIFFGGCKHPQAHTHTHTAHSHLHAHTHLRTQPRARAHAANHVPQRYSRHLSRARRCHMASQVAPIRCALHRFVARCTVRRRSA
jgi:hypothetical protein